MMGMGRGESGVGVDINDAVISPFFVIASAVSVGLFEMVIFGFDFSTNLITFGSGTAAMGFSFANFIAIAALGIAIWTNKPSFGAMSAIETWVAVATVGLVLAPPFMPVLQDILQASDVAGLVAVVIQAGGFATLGYLG